MRNIIKISLLFAVIGSHAQSTYKNYVQETTRRTASVGSFPIVGGTNVHFVTTTYYDGLGRPIQVVDQNSSPDDSQNIVTHIEYEKNIGQVKQYLPFLSTGYTTVSSGGSFPVVTTYYNSNFTESGRSQTQSFYETYNEFTAYPYSENRIEASPRQRVLEAGFPGEPWSLSYDGTASGSQPGTRNTVRTSFAMNISNEVKRYSITTSYSDGIYKNSISESGFYPQNTLTKSLVKNENWKTDHGLNNTVEEFKDSKGNVVLKRTYNNGEAHDTYYVYNRLNLLAFVIPPMAGGSVAAADLDKWAYQYHYDARKRLAEKKLPQKDWEYLVYDKADRMVMSGPVYSPFGDGAKGWLMTKYDNLGRVACTGYYAGSTFTSAVRNTLSQSSFSAETKTAANTTIDGIAVRYTNTGFPTSFKLLTVNYYDDYNFPNAPASFPAVETQTVNTAVKGQPTGSWTRTLTTAASTAGTLSYTLYDDKYRPIRTYSQNHLGGYTQTDNRLSFTGMPVKTVTAQKQNASATVLTVTDNVAYDRRDRLIQQTQQVGTQAAEQLVANTYDALGVLVSKKVGGISTGAGLQKVDYRYNIRGWLTDINDAGMDASDTENDLFQFKINYDRYAMQNRNLYNGNISSVWSRTKTDNLFHGYVYWYDGLNRLTQAKNLYYHRPGGWLIGQYVDDSYGEELTYDKNGNILTLNRTGRLVEGQAVGIDALSYSYNANQLLSVTDATNNSEGFNDAGKVGNDYTYDTFGNITTDKNKGITAISYNHLNLPYKVTFGNGGSISYTYDANGTRLSKKVQPSGGTAVTTDYVNGFDYENGVLQTFPHAEGYVKNNAGTYIYHYIYKDHLGNNRLVYADLNKDGTINPVTEIIEENNYYPFGLKHKGYNEIAGTGYKYKFGGKEFNSELGLELYDFGARNYDAAIGRWLNVDPLAEEFVGATPYNYTLNNPISNIDPDGRFTLEGGAAQDFARMLQNDLDHDYKLNKDGSIKLLNETTDKFDRIFNDDRSKNITVSKSFLWGENPSGRFTSKLPNYGKSAIYNLNNDEVKSGKGNSIFKFFAENSNKEWDYNEFSNTKTGSEFGNLQTSHQSNTVLGVNELVRSVLDGNSDITWSYSEHSHPNATTISEFLPTGWRPASNGGFRKTIDMSTNKPNGDRGFYDGFKSNSKYNTRMPKYHYIYSPNLNKTIRYDNESFNFIK